jgi:hypothetical protein
MHDVPVERVQRGKPSLAAPVGIVGFALAGTTWFRPGDGAAVTLTTSYDFQ